MRCASRPTEALRAGERPRSAHRAQFGHGRGEGGLRRAHRSEAEQQRRETAQAHRHDARSGRRHGCSRRRQGLAPRPPTPPAASGLRRFSGGRSRARLRRRGRSRSSSLCPPRRPSSSPSSSRPRRRPRRALRRTDGRCREPPRRGRRGGARPAGVSSEIRIESAASRSSRLEQLVVHLGRVIDDHHDLGLRVEVGARPEDHLIELEAGEASPERYTPPEGSSSSSVRAISCSSSSGLETRRTRRSLRA